MRSFTIIVLIIACLQSFAQGYIPVDPRLTQKQDILLNQQAEVSLRLADSVLTAIPPKLIEPLERTLALYLLDGVFHDVYAPNRTPVQEFVQKRIEKAADEIESTIVDKGATIWKLYDHGFVVRTGEVTMAFDMIRPSTRFETFFTDTKQVLKRIINECDVLFVSHWHEDHADAWVAKIFLEQGKPVVTPPGVWEDKPFYKQVSHLTRDAKILHKLPVQNGNKTLEVVIYPGHQGKILNNIPVVYTPDGYCFSHNGDQNYGNMKVDTVWINDIKNHHKIDVLMYNSYMSSNWIKGFDPELVLTAHENELGHGIHSRIPYWKIHKRLESISYPYVVMAWGEKYYYLK